MRLIDIIPSLTPSSLSTDWIFVNESKHSFLCVILSV